MNKLDELMGYYYLNNEELIQDVEMEEDEKRRILQAILTKANITEVAPITTQRKKNHKRKFAILIAACITIFAMAAVGFAAVSLNGSWLSIFKPQNQEQTELLNSIGTIIDKQVSKNGLTINIKEAVGDPNAVYVLFDITAPADMVLDKEQYTFVTNYIQIGGLSGGYGLGYSFQELEDTDKTDNVIPMMLQLSSSKKLIGEKMTIRFTDFATYKTEEEMNNKSTMIEPGTPGDANDWYNILVPGEWEITFPLDYKDNSIHINVNQKIEYQNTIIRVRQIRLSPISITMSLANMSHNEVMKFPWLIHMKNGDMIDMNQGNRGAYTGSLKGTIIDAQFDHVIPLEDMESIEFCGTIIPIQQ